MMRFRDPGPDKIVISDTETRELVGNAILTIIVNGKELELNERIKTPEEQELISELLPNIYAEIEELGYKPKLFLPDNIRLISLPSPSSLEEVEEITVLGTANALTNRINVFSPENNLTHLAFILTHELVHTQSFTTFDQRSHNSTDKLLKLRRLGIEVSTEVGTETIRAYKYLNEAITDIIAEFIANQCFKRIKTLEAVNYDYSFAYKSEKDITWAFIMLLHKRNSKSHTEGEILRMLVHSMFTGETLELARLVEQTFGKGSFRELGIRFAKKPIIIYDILERDATV